ncbi:putative isomerase YbhE [Aaosphaeria arxii CBS 175.79]|uniref:Putative isomerase YbhE n=1 Tax=Aaosphaeria arxii CBS 175.79 TaxID=1450172 RepID=A0A6A5X9Y9_9PLEO|nr:putative isomerase YbhE [Aaosphaeria arxii CBS 175.79]KAF2009753.1 putative isomerase YbhE [Aaosphaeria arxii CBS 175.79]
MLSSFTFLIPLFGGLASAQNLWAAHYSGTINYLTFSGGNSLKLTKETKTGNTMPSWITYDGPGKALYLPDETWYSPTGNLVAFKIGENGALTPNGKVATDQSSVATELYGGADGKGFIANAHYEQSSISTFKLPLNGEKPQQVLKWTMSAPGPNAARQKGPHPHHVFTDPTGNFLLAPDLGADIVRIFQIEKASGQLKECPGQKTAPGAGPRHGVFWAPASKSSRVKRGGAADGQFLFILNELGNSVTGYSVTYPSGGGCLTLSPKQTINPYQGNAAAPAGTKLGEIRARDNYLYTSNRNDKKFGPQLDSITQYTIANDGTLTFTELTSAFGYYPRTFDINKAGDYVAIGGQTSATVAIVKRDPKTGKLTGQAASLRIGTTGTPENEDGVSAVVWAE